MGEHAFQAEVGRVLSLVINSLYSNKEIFLRELVSNASDALDRLRFRAVTEPELLGDQTKLVIRVRPDAERNVLVIEDTGIGMTEAELVENLGTVARSGSKNFLEQLEKQTDAKKKDLALIGQFGVGFYSAFLVADRVDVTSRAAGADKAWRWSSTGKDTFSIAPGERTERGTEIVLHLKAEAKEWLDTWHLRDVVRRYSDYIAHPIELVTKKDGADAVDTVNKAGALWQRPKSEITEEQYAELYKHMTHDFDAPLARTHFKVEGNVELVGLFWLPKQVPSFELDDPRKQRGVRLFVKRVLVMEDCDALVPQWLRFVRGLVDSDDLPLNVSRELLQDSSALRTIKKTVTKRILDMLEELATEKKEDYAAFFASSGRVLKEGLAVDKEYKDRIAKLVRYASTSEETTSLADYVSRMKEGQEAIYYLTGESKAVLEGSPHLEALRARGYEVLLMTDPVDSWAADGLEEFDGKKLVDVARSDLKLPEDDETKKKAEEAAKAVEPLAAAAKKALGDRVREVRASSRLRESAAVLALAPSAVPAHIEKMMRNAGRDVARGKRDLELNPLHPAVESLAKLAEKNADDAALNDAIVLLYEQALVAEGSPLDDPNGFAKRITSLLARAVSGGT